VVGQKHDATAAVTFLLGGAPTFEPFQLKLRELESPASHGGLVEDPGAERAKSDGGGGSPNLQP
jgi:hypothetical protein